eukprot:TRINITY_DN5901_c0_g1_i4.p1 TRINITY_DN5901_c0_g1~~TRINITY_DN5901_c0_g1_i4.p1  ORF type:complete len:197 (-),score=50.36 TRINITY_DN5901_c0_g1_i4:107-637(-)
MHKWLLTNFDCSLLWIDERSYLVEALSITPEYLRNKASESGQVIDYRDWQIPLGRRFRSLKIWFVVRLFGVAGLQNHIRKHIKFADEFERLVKEDSNFEFLSRNFSLICFRLKATNDQNKLLLDKINSTGIFLSHTMLKDKFAIRFAIGATLTELHHVTSAWETIQTEAKKLLSEN